MKRIVAVKLVHGGIDLVFILLFLVLWSVGEVALFRFVNGPTILLRQVQRQEIALDEEQLRLLTQAALGERFKPPDTLYVLEMLEARGRKGDALAVLSKMTSDLPNDQGLRLRLADMLSAQGQYGKAHEHYVKITPAKGITEEMVLLRIARNATSAGWQPEAQQFYSQYLEKVPGDSEVRAEYAGFLLQLGERQLVTEQYLLLLKQEPVKADWLLQAADAATSMKDFDTAEVHLRQALVLAATDETRHKLARVLSWNRKYDASLELYAELLAKPADTIDIPGIDGIALRQEMVDVLLWAGRYADYLQESQSLVQADLRNVALRLGRMRAGLAIQQFETAIMECNEILKVEPEHREALRTRAQCALWMGRHTQAQKELEALTMKFPADTELLKLLGQAYLWDQKYEQALVPLRKLKPETLTDPEVSQGYGEALVGHKGATPDDVKRVKALAAAVEKLEREDLPLPLIVATARALVVAGDGDRGVDLLEGAVSRAPKDRALRLELADLLQQLGRNEEAEKHYQMLLEGQ